MRHEVVVFDPEGILPEGRVFQQDEALGRAKRRGVVFVQIDGRLKPKALTPYAKFFYGDGLAVNPLVPSYVGHGALWLARDRAFVAWAAMLRHEVGTKPLGLLRLVGDPSQPPLGQAPVSDNTTNRASVSAPLSAGESWTVVSGVVPCQVGIDGIYAFALHGYATGARLAWLALSQAS
jgi:hypothetical protein